MKVTEIYRLVFTATMMTLLVNTSAMADPVSIRLEINGQVVEGESTITSMGRANTIEALSASISGSNTSKSGKGEYAPFAILKKVDIATPRLVRAMAMGEQVDRLEANYFKPSPSGDGTTVLYYTIVLENGHVDSIRQQFDTLAAGASAVAMEMVEFSFNTITFIDQYGSGGQFQDTVSK